MGQRESQPDPRIDFQMVSHLISIGQQVTFKWSAGDFQIGRTSILNRPSPREVRMYPRFLKNRIHAALSDTRVVMVSGPRQSGKTTLVGQVAAEQYSFSDAR